MSLQLRTEVLYQLELKGSTGIFNVGNTENSNSIEVKYLLTHVGLDFEHGNDEVFLSHMNPVREIFKYEDQDFDEIMQRDIDDARVSHELIPYLLDTKSRDLLKLFPPIIVILIPIKANDTGPDSKYPKMADPKDKEINGQIYRILTSGSNGTEIFEFAQPIVDGKLLNHDLVSLKIQTTKTKLVIVDGQHRAMALLALYRNLRDGWDNEKRSSYKDFYQQWTGDHIRKFNLTNIQLPVMVCTFPKLDETYEGDLNLQKAARSIFLVLNKPARKVSVAKMKLLDDNDIISSFLRNILNSIKKINLESSYSLRIHNFELDAPKDNTKINNDICISAVNHLYVIIEKLLLNKPGDIIGINNKNSNFANRTRLDEYPFFERLNGRNHLGADLADKTDRKHYNSLAENKLNKKFSEIYGKLIENIYQKFKPFEIHNSAVLQLKQVVERETDRKILPLLFGGQGMKTSFEEHSKEIKDNISNNEHNYESSELREIDRSLKVTRDLINDRIQVFLKDRAERFIHDITPKTSIYNTDCEFNSNFLIFLNKNYFTNMFFTSAFQTALTYTFFQSIEDTNKELLSNSMPKLDYVQCLDNYLDSLNTFFVPQTVSNLKKLIKIFLGDLDGKISEFKIDNSSTIFKKIVFKIDKETMDPNKWPYYRYLILEIWREPNNNILKQLIIKERDVCRDQIYQNLYKRYLDLHMESNDIKSVEDLTKEDTREISKNTYDNYSKFLKKLGHSMSDIPNKTSFEEKRMESGFVMDNETITNESEDMYDNLEIK